jgi:hypothetical protein
LSACPELYSLYNESRFIFRKFYLRKLGEKPPVLYSDDALSEQDLSDRDVAFFREQFHKYSVKNKYLGQALQRIILKRPELQLFGSMLLEGNKFYKDNFVEEYRFVEKAPRNCFKVSLMNRIFPDALFIFLKRDPRSNISSLIEGWRKRKGPQKGSNKRLPKPLSDLNLTNYDGKEWRFAMPPGWEQYANKSLEELCAYQWLKSNECALEGLSKIPEHRKFTISYEELTDPKTRETLIEDLCNFSEISYSKQLEKIVEESPEVNYLGERPHKDKWKKNADAIAKIMPMISPVMQRLGYTNEVLV